jgi:hypothetical protein
VGPAPRGDDEDGRAWRALTGTGVLQGCFSLTKLKEGGAGEQRGQHRAGKLSPWTHAVGKEGKWRCLTAVC